MTAAGKWPSADMKSDLDGGQDGQSAPVKLESGQDPVVVGESLRCAQPASIGSGPALE